MQSSAGSQCDDSQLLVRWLSISADKRESGRIWNKNEEGERKRDKQQMPAVWLKTNSEKREIVQMRGMYVGSAQGCRR